MSEIIFIVENSDEGGYTAKALDYSIYTEGETFEELKKNVKDAVRCHFDPAQQPHIARLHMVKDELMAIRNSLEKLAVKNLPKPLRN
jgi:predicted RNase H-like HicB family nuclease